MCSIPSSNMLINFALSVGKSSRYRSDSNAGITKAFFSDDSTLASRLLSVYWNVMKVISIT